MSYSQFCHVCNWQRESPMLHQRMTQPVDLIEHCVRTTDKCVPPIISSLPIELFQITHRHCHLMEIGYG
jgi:hypothetical protein